MAANATMRFLHFGDGSKSQDLSPGNMGDDRTFPSPNEPTYQSQFVLYANEHCYARWVSSAEIIAVSFATLVVGCVPETC